MIDPLEDLQDAAAPLIGRNWNRLSSADSRLFEGWETIELAITGVVSAFFFPYLKVLGEYAAKETLARLGFVEPRNTQAHQARALIRASDPSSRDEARSAARVALEQHLLNTALPGSERREIVQLLFERLQTLEGDINATPEMERK